jgi:hypothetical protein
MEVQDDYNACANRYYCQPHLSTFCLIRPMRPKHGRIDILFVNEIAPAAQEIFFW